FDQIANYRGGRGGKAKSFEIGWESDIDIKKIPAYFRRGSVNKNTRVRYLARFERSGSQPFVSRRSISFNGSELSAFFNSSGEVDSVKLVGPSLEIALSAKDVELIGRMRARASS